MLCHRIYDTYVVYARLSPFYSFHSYVRSCAKPDAYDSRACEASTNKRARWQHNWWCRLRSIFFVAIFFTLSPVLGTVSTCVYACLVAAVDCTHQILFCSVVPVLNGISSEHDDRRGSNCS